MLLPSITPLLLSVVCPWSMQAGREPAARGGADTSALVEGIRRAEYRFGAVKGESDVWSAPNRAHELRSRVSAGGVEVFPRATSADGEGAIWKLRLGTTSFGRTDGVFELPRASVSVADERVELDHGYLVEWFVNDERGIEQGWTLPERPIGSELLVIGLSVEGDLGLRIDEGGRSGVFVDACGEAVIGYRGLLAFDATGRELEARLVSTTAGVAVEVDDAGATYPLVVDPLLTGPGWSAESDSAGAFFGTSVSTAGDVNGDGYADIVIGAPQFDGGQPFEGRVYVFQGSSSGLASSPAWTVESNVAYAYLGNAVGTAGDVNGDGYSDVLVAAPRYSSNAFVSVFHGGPSGLAAHAAWTIDNGFAESLGRFQAPAGDVNGDGYSDVIVSGQLEDPDTFEWKWHDFVFYGSSAGLSSTPDWSIEAVAIVSSAGDLDSDGHSDIALGAGSTVYWFRGTPSGPSFTGWTFTHPDSIDWGDPNWPQLEATSAGDVNADGYGDLLVYVGLHDHTAIPLTSGEAFLFLGSATGPSSAPAWTVEPFQFYPTTFPEYSRCSIASAGDVNGDGHSDVVLGGIDYSTGEGGAYVYLGSTGGLATSGVEIAWPSQPGAYFGFSVSSAGDVDGDGFADVLVGAPGYDNGEPNEGRVFVYYGAARALPSSPSWSAQSAHVDDDFALSVSTAGDVNGDGYSDVIIGAPDFDNGHPDEGRALVYLGSSSGLHSGNPDWAVEPDEPDMYLGTSVSTAGDVNGDGYSDVIVCALTSDLRGRLYAYHGSAAGLGTSPAWSVTSDQADAWFGSALSSAGDVNGDGYSDVIVGAYKYDGVYQGEGRAYVYLGSASGLAASAAWVSGGLEEDDAHFGSAVATAGDVDADGFSDVIVGTSGSPGRAFVYHGRAAGLETSPTWIAEMPGDFGSAVSTAGDVNGDGYSDVIVGDQTFAGGELNEGRVHVYHGSPTGLAASPAWSVESNLAHAWFGGAVSSAGDVNGDGYSDVVVGSSFNYPDGRAFAYLGSASGLATSPAWVADPEPGYTGFGETLSTAGDVNGDGYADVIVGAPGNEKSNVGGAFLFLGNEGASGAVRAFQQRTSDGSRPLALHGLVRESFRIRCEFDSDLAGVGRGTTTAHLEWEVKPLRVPFDGTNVQRGADQAVGGLLVFDELALLDDGVRHARATKAQSYRWRARVVTNDPQFPHTPWFSAPGNGMTEAKLRKPARRSP